MKLTASPLLNVKKEGLVRKMSELFACVTTATTLHWYTPAIQTSLNASKLFLSMDLSMSQILINWSCNGLVHKNLKLNA